MNNAIQPPETIRWTRDGGGLVILDQTRLPEDRVEKELRSLEDVEEAICSLRVRGAPLIGLTAAMGIAALARQFVSSADGGDGSGHELRSAVAAWCERLATARPTAVNLEWAVERMLTVCDSDPGATAGKIASSLRREAEAVREEDARMCRRIGEHAVTLLRDGGSVLTHCNAGSLATGGIGTALAPIYVAAERGIRIHVYADETRPLLQGSRLTAWELQEAGIDVTVLTDGAAARLMSESPPDIVLVGSDRIAANGDVANKIGTFGVALAARHHGVPFYVLAPTSTVDLSTPDGDHIPIEHRDGEEVRAGFGRTTAPAGVKVWSPAFDVTPAGLIAGIVSEQGIHRPPYEQSLRDAVLAAQRETASGR
jgi:methylthioribose-1-phosphate isomerase